MYKDLLEVFDKHASHIKFDYELFNNIANNNRRWEQKDNDYIAFLGGDVLGVHPIRYSSIDEEYFFYISLGIPFYMFGQAMNPVIRADGSPKFAMASTLAGAVINIILDPIFIFICKWGMMGAAVATVIGQIVTAVLAIGYLMKMNRI